MNTSYKILILLCAFGLFSCRPKPTAEPTIQELAAVNDVFVYDSPPYFPPMPFPENNKPTNRKFELGKKLFFDKILSQDYSISCASCHSQHLAFSDSTQFSIGSQSQIGERNSTTLTNIGYNTSFFWDGGVPSLELQALAPLDNHKEFNLNYDSMLIRLNLNAEYKKLFMDAFGENANLSNYTKALACYQRAFISGNSKYDDYYFKKNESVYNSSEIKGYQLFTSAELACNTCHSGFNFTNVTFQNNGLYKTYPDQGRYKVTGFIQDLARFKVPTLRNIALTAPYMHDGSIKTLEAVVEHYNQGGKGHSNQSNKIKPLNLTTEQKNDLVNFLKSLTDYEFISRKKLSP